MAAVRLLWAAVVVLLLSVGRAASEEDPEPLGAHVFKSLHARLAEQPDDGEPWSAALLRAAASDLDLLPEDAFGDEMGQAVRGGLDTCGSVTLREFASLARAHLTCGKASFCTPEGKFAECKPAPSGGGTLAELSAAGVLDCYVPVHVVPPDSPDVNRGCNVDMIGNMAMVHAGWALEHVRGADARLQSHLEWRDGVHPQQGARPRPAAAVGRFARELAALGGPMSLLEPRRLLVECGGCSLHQDAHTLLLGEVRDEL
ncbi:hypothetical protein FNF31_03157 [Cafeteria roenbergensis]|uniref:Uncharacterized protein n=1 Tax=Cafeteria roenbergensis TaxID=33653 RepID=A0A5A8DCG1_CAFRO|nr:hypothetical protein FNF31_03157 [Cafeteria roenbergensis]KAA0170721.1 hypothetical protein FNF28_01262 [Cafeteria roenbergensis]